MRPLGVTLLFLAGRRAKAASVRRNCTKWILLATASAIGAREAGSADGRADRGRHCRERPYAAAGGRHPLGRRGHDTGYRGAAVGGQLRAAPQRCGGGADQQGGPGVSGTDGRRGGGHPHPHLRA
eukprot:ctg_1068.g436